MTDVYNNLKLDRQNEALSKIIEQLRGIREDLQKVCDDYDQRAKLREINELCARLRELPRDKRPLAFESGAPDMFGPLWRFNAREALGEC
jgi:hypothetical protein